MTAAWSTVLPDASWRKRKFIGFSISSRLGFVINASIVMIIGLRLRVELGFERASCTYIVLGWDYMLLHNLKTSFLQL